jgi:hypothetical protein
MELSTLTRDPAFNLDDLRALADMGLLRLPIEEAESRRANRMRAVVATATELSRTLASYTHCMLVNCQGSHGTGNLVTETEQLHAALARYAELVRSVASDRRRILDTSGTGPTIESAAGTRERATVDTGSKAARRKAG